MSKSEWEREMMDFDLSTITLTPMEDPHDSIASHVELYRCSQPFSVGGEEVDVVGFEVWDEDDQYNVAWPLYYNHDRGRWNNAVSNELDGGRLYYYRSNNEGPGELEKAKEKAKVIIMEILDND